MLVMPRKYGGLCLPVLEAAARGLALVMTDTVPNSDWPIVPIPVQRTFVPRKKHVTVDKLYFTNPQEVARIVDSLQGQPLREAQERAVAWAESLAWSKWAGEYRMLLERAAKEIR